MEEKEIVKRQGSTPAAVIEYAITKDAPIEQIEKLLLLQERYDANEAKKAYNIAMATFKANPPEIDKDKTVKYSQVEYKHASLYNVTEKINTELSKHGLSASWTTKQNGAVQVTCKITHKQGHSEETTLSAPADTSGSKNAIQAIGSTVTYLQRYTLLALAGLATFDDDDGHAAATEYIDEKQKHELTDMLIDTKADEGKLCQHLKVENLDMLPKNRFQEAMAVLKARKEKKK